MISATASAPIASDGTHHGLVAMRSTLDATNISCTEINSTNAPPTTRARPPTPGAPAHGHKIKSGGAAGARGGGGAGRGGGGGPRDLGRGGGRTPPPEREGAPPPAPPGPPAAAPRFARARASLFIEPR